MPDMNMSDDVGRPELTHKEAWFHDLSRKRQERLEEGLYEANRILSETKVALEDLDAKVSKALGEEQPTNFIDGVFIGANRWVEKGWKYAKLPLVLAALGYGAVKANDARVARRDRKAAAKAAAAAAAAAPVAS